MTLNEIDSDNESIESFNRYNISDSESKDSDDKESKMFFHESDKAKI